jgi:hypothetical protein
MSDGSAYCCSNSVFIVTLSAVENPWCAGGSSCGRRQDEAIASDLKCSEEPRSQRRVGKSGGKSAAHFHSSVSSKRGAKGTGRVTCFAGGV